MGRPAAANPKRNVIAVRLSDPELAFIDSVRGSLTHSEWIRWMLLKMTKERP